MRGGDVYMDDRMSINRPIYPSNRVNTPQQTKGQASKTKNNQKSFENILANKLEKKSGLSFSKHARKRILSRNIQITENQLNQLQTGVEKLKEKGAKESLVMVNNTAYLVSVENNTVITAIDDENIRENVFTNIDSAVMM